MGHATEQKTGGSFNGIIQLGGLQLIAQLAWNLKAVSNKVSYKRTLLRIL